MFGGGDEDDGDFITAPSGSNLASLFGGVDASGQGNPFQFHAPKQPRKGQPSAGTHLPLQSVKAIRGIFIFVFVFSSVNGQYASRGKLGLALLGSPEAKDYKLLLYGQQRKTVTSARIHSSFAFSVQANNYASFYDDQRQNWSIMFDNEQVASDFSTQVCLAKWQATPREELGKALIQDLRLGEGQGVEAGDNLEVEYTGWILEPSGALGEVFDSNVGKEKMMRLKLGKGKVIKGWEQGMLGMGKGGRRLLLVPAPLGYGAQGLPPRIPANSSLAFRVEIKRVRFARDAGATDLRDCHSPSPAPSLVEAPPTLTAPQTPPPPPGSDESVKSRSHSLTEQLTVSSQPDSVRAKLISRMARMGQPLLPMGGGATPAQGDTSDSEHEDGGLAVGTPGGAVRTPSPQPRAVPTSTPTTAGTPHHSLLTTHSPLTRYCHSLTSSLLAHHSLTTHSTLATHSLPLAPYHSLTTHSPLARHSLTTRHSLLTTRSPLTHSPLTHHSLDTRSPPTTGPPPPSPRTGDVTSFLMTEARQHNTEVRLAIGKVSDKMEQLQSKDRSLICKADRHTPTCLQIPVSCSLCAVCVCVYTRGPGVGGANASGDVANGASRPREDAAPLSVATTSLVEELEEVKEVVEVEVEAPPPPGDGASEPTAGAAEGRDLGDGSAEAAATAGVEGKAAERECDTTTVTTATAAVVVVAVTVAVEEDTAVAGNGVPERPTSVAGIPQQPPSSAGDDEDDDEEQEDGNLFSYEAPDKKVSRDDSGSPVDKPGPPPLFGDDEEDDDDVDWLK
ncbi:unnamed protein product [Lampetra planeri]